MPVITILKELIMPTRTFLRDLYNLWSGKTTVLLATPSGTTDLNGDPQAAPVGPEHPLPVVLYVTRDGALVPWDGYRESASPANPDYVRQGSYDTMTRYGTNGLSGQDIYSFQIPAPYPQTGITALYLTRGGVEAQLSDNLDMNGEWFGQGADGANSVEITGPTAPFDSVRVTFP